MTDTNEAPRTHVTVIAEMKSKVGKLARQEAKATESDEAAAAFNEDILAMATGEVAQTATRSIATVAKEQEKHVKRASKVRENNKELASEIANLQDEFNSMVDGLLAPYGIEEVAEEAEDETEE